MIIRVMKMRASIRQTVLPVREDHGISTHAPRLEYDLAASAQTVDGKKHSVPHEVWAVMRDFSEAAYACVKYDVDHLIVCSNLFSHLPPAEERNTLRSVSGLHGRCHRLATPIGKGRSKAA